MQDQRCVTADNFVFFILTRGDKFGISRIMQGLWVLGLRPVQFLAFIGKMRGKVQTFDGPLWPESGSFVPQK